MTRETKLGLIVAGSFLALVGTVMGLKKFLPQGNPAEAKAVADTHQTAPATPETKRANSTPEPTHLEIKPANPAEKLVIPGDDLITISPAPKTVHRAEDQQFRPSARPMDDSKVTPAANKTPNTLLLDEQPELMIPDSPKKKDPPALVPGKADNLPLLDEIAPPKSVEIHVKKDVLRLPVDDLAPPPGKPNPKPDTEKLTQLPPVELEPLPTVPTVKKENRTETVPEITFPGQPKEEIAPLPKPKDNPATLEMPPSTGPITIRPATPKKQEPVDPLAGRQPAKIEFGNSKSSANVPPEIKPSEAPPARDPAPAVAGKPSEDDYEEDLYTMRDGDNYRAISKLHYRSENYATALMKYNQANHGAQARYIRIPPVWVLEKRYPADITGGPQTTNFSPPAAVDAPRPPNVYIVSGTGEYLAEVAQKTLGNEDAWTRIKELNKNINEVKRIPAGTRLILPPDAKSTGN
jgi:hypothetical protein